MKQILTRCETDVSNRLISSSAVPACAGSERSGAAQRMSQSLTAPSLLQLAR
jgi:hypothetical protein